MLVPEHDAGQRFDLDVLHRIALDLREVAHLRLCELDVFQILSGQLVDAALNLVGREPVRVAVPAVELDAELAHRRIAARRDVGQDALDRIADLAIAVGLRLGSRATLEPLSHRLIPSPCR